MSSHCLVDQVNCLQEQIQRHRDERPALLSSDLDSWLREHQAMYDALFYAQGALYRYEIFVETAHSWIADRYIDAQINRSETYSIREASRLVIEHHTRQCPYCDFEGSYDSRANGRRGVDAHIRQVHRDKYKGNR